MNLTRWMFAVAGLALVIACGPIGATSAISDSERALAFAEREGAAKYATYEYRKAAALLEEAKVKRGFAEYEVAKRYAQASLEMAIQASKRAKTNRPFLERGQNPPTAPRKPRGNLIAPSLQKKKGKGDR